MFLFFHYSNLTSVTLPSTDVITYEIDGLNRRIGKKLNGVLQKRWVYMDQIRIAAELDSAGNIAKRFVYASKGNIPDYMIMGGENYRIISDHLGSPRLVVKVSDGTITGMMDHDEYGRVITDTNPGLLPFGFAGGLYDVDTGLVRFGARDYDSETGRWTAKDPILFGGGDTNLFGYTGTVGKPGIETNLYGYSFNDPVNFIDPTGLWGEDILANYLTPERQILVGGAMAATGVYILNSSLPAVFSLPGFAGTAVGLALISEGGANLKKGINRSIDSINGISQSSQNGYNKCEMR